MLCRLTGWVCFGRMLCRLVVSSGWMLCHPLLCSGKYFATLDALLYVDALPPYGLGWMFCHRGSSFALVDASSLGLLVQP